MSLDTYSKHSEKDESGTTWITTVGLANYLKVDAEKVKSLSLHHMSDKHRKECPIEGQTVNRIWVDDKGAEYVKLWFEVNDKYKGE